MGLNGYTHKTDTVTLCCISSASIEKENAPFDVQMHCLSMFKMCNAELEKLF